MKKYDVIWSRSAEFDLESVIEYLKHDSVTMAKEIFFAIKQECDQLNYLPDRKRIVPELQQMGILKYREILFKRWRIVFKIENYKVFVLLVVDSSRNFEDVMFQRLLS